MIRTVRGERITAMAQLRPYGMHAFLLAYTVVLLVVDGRFAGRGTQAVLGLLTFGVLAVCLVRLEGRQRLAALICVPVATLFEVFGSLIWGGYHYRFGNIPLYVPPGHALVYVFGITAAALPFVESTPGSLPPERPRGRRGLGDRRGDALPAHGAPLRRRRPDAPAAARALHPAHPARDDVRRHLHRRRDARDRRHAGRRLDLGGARALERDRLRQPALVDRRRLRGDRRHRRARRRGRALRAVAPTPPPHDVQPAAAEPAVSLP